MNTWVKVKDSDIRLVYPMRRVDSKEGCQCDHFTHANGDRSAGLHYHFEDDLNQEPTREWKPPTILQANEDGTFTSWGYTVWGPVGRTGQLREGVEVEELRTRKDKQALNNHKQASLVPRQGSPQALAVGGIGPLAPRKSPLIILPLACR